MDNMYAKAVCPPVSSYSDKAESGSAVYDKNCACGSSVNIEDVRIHYSPAPPIQRRPFPGGVIQFAAHIEVLRELEEEQTKIPVIPSKKPTMVFESMGTTKEAFQNVYAQSEKYTGNTVCVFGLNRKKPPQSEKAPKNELTPEKDISNGLHHAVSFSFEWIPPAKPEVLKGYEMPFVEARSLVMEQANKLKFEPAPSKEGTSEHKEDTTPKEKEEEKEEDLSIYPVYRWIDGDAQDDSSEKMETEFLTSFARQTDLRIATGTYRWRHEAGTTAANAPTYHRFIKQLNKKEAFLRKTYMGRMYWETKGIRRGGAYIQGAYYLPESTFLMNQAAHGKISSAGAKINLEGDQSRESEKLIEKAQIAPKNIRYRKDLHVTKPLKREFEKGGYAASLIKFFSSASCSEEGLKTALREHRQSAFGNQWKPQGAYAESEYNKKKELHIKELHKFLSKKKEIKVKGSKRTETNFESIHREIESLTKDSGKGKPKGGRGKK